MCIFGVPVSGITGTGALSARYFFLGNCELVRLTGVDDKFAAIPLPDVSRNGVTEVAVTKSVDESLNQAIARLAELRSAVLPGASMVRIVMHCATALSGP